MENSKTHQTECPDCGGKIGKGEGAFCHFCRVWGVIGYKERAEKTRKLARRYEIGAAFLLFVSIIILISPVNPMYCIIPVIPCTVFITLLYQMKKTFKARKSG